MTKGTKVNMNEIDSRVNRNRNGTKNNSINNDEYARG